MGVRGFIPAELGTTECTSRHCETMTVSDCAITHALTDACDQPRVLQHLAATPTAPPPHPPTHHPPTHPPPLITSKGFSEGMYSSTDPGDCVSIPISSRNVSCCSCCRACIGNAWQRPVGYTALMLRCSRPAGKETDNYQYTSL
jgi:hypothetical protein